MLIDALQLPENHVVECDLCIVGAGAAGITLARQLAGGPLRVVLLESGGLTAEGATQDLYRGTVDGLAYTPLEAARVRYFGGTTNHWSGMCRPLDPIDFERRDWVPHSGWPFGREELDPYYDAAQALFGLAPLGFAVDTWESDSARRLPLPDGDVGTAVFRFTAPARFGQLYEERLRAAANIDVYLRANVLQIGLDDGGARVAQLTVGCLPSKRFTVKARNYVLAAGGIENPRLLLASRDVQRNGVGNGRDLVGRFFMDHPGVVSGAILLTGERISTELYEGAARQVDLRDKIDGGNMEPFLQPGEKDAILGWAARGRDRNEFEALVAPILQRSCVTCHNPDGIAFFRPLRTYDEVVAVVAGSADRAAAAKRDVMGGLALAPATMRREGLLNYCALLEEARGWSEVLSGSSLWDSIANVATSFGDLVGSLYERQFDSANRRRLLRVVSILEPSPNPDSRVTLGDDRDAFGTPRVRLNWRLNDADKRTVQRAHELLGVELGRTDLGRALVRFDAGEAGWPATMTHGWHHMGTTRMHADASQGVVDADCKVHGVDNLFVAGSSVFPTYGFSQPTFTIVALALRLAEHLRGL